MKRKLIILCAICFLLSGCSAKEETHTLSFKISTQWIGVQKIVSI